MFVRKKKKALIKCISLLSAVTLLAGGITGCGVSGESSQTGSTSESESSQAEITSDSGASSAEITSIGESSSAESSAESSGSQDAIEITINNDCEKLTKEETDQLVTKVYEEYCAEALKDPDRIRETTCEAYQTRYTGDNASFDCASISYQGYEMKYVIQVIGEPDEDGTYPLYIALHGGGADEDPGVNDEQWEQMFYYYKDSITSGIYVSVRGIADTWNTHSLDESYYMYDRLIEDMILFKHADANRVYVMGFSAGGDGVYQIAARMADRITAGNMSSGHPNGVSLTNLANLPILLQAGIRDNYYDRNAVTVQSGLELENDAEKYGFGYEHEVFIHVPEGHNYQDNNNLAGGDQLVLADPSELLTALKENEVFKAVVNNPDYAYEDDPAIDEEVMGAVEDAELSTEMTDTNAVHWVSQYSRDPYPEKLVWDLDTRAALRTVDSFYYLKAPAETKGILTASYSSEENAVYVDASQAEGDFSILLNPGMLDLSQPVLICVNDTSFLVNVSPSEECIRKSLEETSDLNRVYAAEISCSELLSYVSEE